GVHLLHEVAGQVAELFARFHRGAHQHDAARAVLLQGRHRAGHREVGLAGAGGADAEAHVVRLDVAQVEALVGTASPDDAALRGDGAFVVRYRLRPVVRVRLLQGEVDLLRRERLVARCRVKLRQETRGDVRRAGRADHAEMPAAVVDLDAEPPLDLPQVRIERSAQVCQPFIVRWLEGHLRSDGVKDVLRGAQGSAVASSPTARWTTGSPRRVLAQAAVMRTSTNAPMSEGSPGKLTMRSLLVRPHSSPGSRRDGPSTRTRSVRPTMDALMASAWRWMASCRRMSRSFF